MNMKIFAVLALVLLIGAAYASNSGGQGAGDGNGKEGNGVLKEKNSGDQGRGYSGGGDDDENESSSCGRNCASLNGTCRCGTPVPVILKPVRITLLNPANKTITRACPWFCDRSNGGCDCSLKVQLNTSFNMTNQTFWKPKNFCNCACFGNASNTTYPCQLQNCSGSNVTTCSCLNGTNCTAISTLPCMNLAGQNLTNCSCSTISNYTCSAYNSTCSYARNKTCSCACAHQGLGPVMNKIMQRLGDDNKTNETASGIAGILERTRERVRNKIENALNRNSEKIADMLYKLAAKIEKYAGNRFGLIKTEGDATITGQVETEGGPAFVNMVTYKRLPTWAIRERLRNRVSVQDIYGDFESDGADTTNGAMAVEGEQYEVGG